MEENNKVLVYGIGNEILTDDGIGPKLVKRLSEGFPDPRIKYETSFVGGLEILEYIQGYERIVFIDAIKTGAGIPGDIYFYTPGDFKETLHLSSIHDVSFLTALELGKSIGYKITDKIEIIAIEIVEDRIFNDLFSPQVEDKYDEIYDKVENYIKSIV